MTTNFLQAQMPNRKGNISKKPPMGNTGVTAGTGSNKCAVANAPGSQGAPKAMGDVNCARDQKVQVSRPAGSYGANDGYRSSSFLK